METIERERSMPRRSFPRRTLLKAAAVPFVPPFLVPAVFHPQDRMAQQLAKLAPGEWSPNLITAAGGTNFMSMPGFVGVSSPNYNSYYGHAGFTPRGVNGIPWAYGSGVFLPDRNKYLYTGGGHGDWLGSQIGSFDFPSLSWTQTDDSAQIDIIADPGAPFWPVNNGATPLTTLAGNVGVSDTTIPVVDGSSFPANGPFAILLGNEYLLVTNAGGNSFAVTARGYAGTMPAAHNAGDNCDVGYFPWPNKSGRRTPISSHMYGGMAYMKELGLVQVMGGSDHPSGNGQPGGAMCIDVATGRWSATYACAHLGAIAPVVQWIPDCKIVGGGTAGRTFWFTNGNILKLCDPTANHWEPAGAYFSALGAYYCRGTMIPDPINAGYRAWLTVAATAPTTQACLCQQIDVTGPNPNKNMIYYPFANTGPAPGGANVNAWVSAMIYMGDDRPGSRQVVFFDPSSPGEVYLLDTSTMGPNGGGTWSGPVVLTGTPPNTTLESAAGHDNGVWKRFFYHPTYDAFCFFCGPSGVSGADNAADVGLYAFKRPSVIA